MAEPATDPAAPAAVSQPTAATPAAPVIDIQAEITKALHAHSAQFAADFKAATGFESLKAFSEDKLKNEGRTNELLAAKTQESDSYKSRFEQSLISNALLVGSNDALDPSLISDLLRGKASVTEDGTVSIGGKTVSEAIKALLTEKPFLAKVQGLPGSGAPQNVQIASVNPFTKAQWNLTEQLTLKNENPTLAAQLKAAAGIN